MKPAIAFVVKCLAGSALFALLLTGRTSAAADFLLTSESRLWIAPQSYSGQLLGPVGVGGPQPSWYVAQWGLPAPLPTTTTSLGGGAWEVGNNYAKVHYLPLDKAYELSVGGSSSPCSAGYGVHLSPVTPVYPAYPQRMLHQADTQPLSALSAFWMEAGVQVMEETTFATCSGLKYSAHVMAIGLYNEASQQILYYQVIVRDSRGIQPTGAWCPGQTGPQYCVDDGIQPVYGEPVAIPASGRKYYQIDVAQRVRSLISTGYSGIDTDLSHWKISTFYFGPSIGGRAKTRSRWDSFGVAGG